jgi:hypothetical protein
LLRSGNVQIHRQPFDRIQTKGLHASYVTLFVSVVAAVSVELWKGHNVTEKKQSRCWGPKWYPCLDAFLCSASPCLARRLKPIKTRKCKVCADFWPPHKCLKARPNSIRLLNWQPMDYKFIILTNSMLVQILSGSSTGSAWITHSSFFQDGCSSVLPSPVDPSHHTDHCLY